MTATTRDDPGSLNHRGPVPALTASEAEHARDLHASGTSAQVIAGMYGVSKRTVYRALHRDVSPVELKVMALAGDAGLDATLAERLARECTLLLELAFRRLVEQEAGEAYRPCRGHYDRPPCEFPGPPVRRYAIRPAPGVVVRRVAGGAA